MSTTISNTSLPSTTVAFIVGLGTTFAISVLIWRRRDVVGLTGRVVGARGLLWVDGVSLGKKARNGRHGNGEEMRDENAREEEESETAATEDRAVSDVVNEGRARQKKPFDFRERLWNEPPEDRDLGGALYDDYRDFEYYDMVQKEFKLMGGKDLQWRTEWLDFKAECFLLSSYSSWAWKAKTSGEAMDEDMFYRGLCNSINADFRDTSDEFVEIRRKHGKTQEDVRELNEILSRVQEREEARQNQRS